MNGKNKCKILKEIRRQIAEQNDIEYVTSECQHKGDCKGTCPKCEAEVRYLEKELEKRQKLGRTVAVVGIAAALAVSSVGCASDNGDEIPDKNKPDNSIVDDGFLQGDIISPGVPEDLTGDPVPDPGEVVSSVGNISDLLKLSADEQNEYISGFSKFEIRYEWGNEDSVLGDTQDIFYTEDGDYKIIVDYDEGGMAIAIEIIFIEMTDLMGDIPG